MKSGTTDKTIEQSVMRELEWDPRVKATRIGVTAKDGAVVLSGRVDSYAERVGAVRAAERVYGVRAVADEIEVKPATPSNGSDEEVAETIARQLACNSVVPDTVKAEVRQGHVTLRGTVEWSHQREAAERPLEQMCGVYGISNEITLKAPAKPKAADVEEEVHQAIARMADLDARSIGVTVRNGTVHLRGNVHSLAERRIAEEAAASAGAVTVKNDIAVTP
ncbi:MAG: BON domain-containing protein [Solirubrobacteraceae bacterium]